MIKYVKEDTNIVFQELPNEVTLALNISNCCNNCIGCHSPYLRDNIGKELTPIEINKLIDNNYGITAICFMGEGNDKIALQNIIKYINITYPNIKIGLYSGRNTIDDQFYWDYLDYIKIGPYIEKYGPLNNKKTNQIMYYKDKSDKTSKWINITEKFWKK